MPYKDPEKRRAYNQAWRLRNPEKVKAQQRRAQQRWYGINGLGYSRAWRDANPEKVKESNKRNHARLSPIYRDKIAWLKARPCLDCDGVFPPECMDFDHVPGRGSKLFELGFSSMGRSQVSVDSEIAKCDLVCSNCHRIRTRKRTND